MLGITDYFYSPITWIIINIGILLSIIFIIRTTNKVKRTQEALSMNKLFQEFIDTLNKDVEMNQRELASYYSTAIIKYLTFIGLSQIEQGQTFREFIESIKPYRFISEDDLDTLIKIYERLRFSNEVVDRRDIEKMKSTLLKIGKSAKSYIESRSRGDLSGPS